MDGLSVNSPTIEWLAATALAGYPGAGGSVSQLAKLLVECDDIGHEPLFGMLDELADRADEHLDVFCRIERSPSLEIGEAAREILATHHRAVLEAGILVVCAQLLRTEPRPRGLFPSRMLSDLGRELSIGSRNHVLEELFGRARSAAMMEWRRLADVFDQIDKETSLWAQWPAHGSCVELIDALELTQASWGVAVEEMRVRYRGGPNRPFRRDPAFRRAREWWRLARQLAHPLILRRGDLLLTLEYWLTVLHHFDGHRSIGDGCSAWELLVHEILALFGQPRARDFEPELAPLELRTPTRRKRIQRARLRVMFDLIHPISDHGWTAQLLPCLSRLGGQLPCDH